MSARVSFEHNTSGARVEGEYIADTGIAWMVKAGNLPVLVLSQDEWSSVPARADSPLGGSLRDYLRGF
ncbi:MAG: hypothetical protein K0Q52_204 [Microbacterium sp.]|jgi:hypothetical protein|nr:hypothetical protein [Microbacterium sp.]